MDTTNRPSEAFEELASVALAAVGGVVSLLAQDGDELRSGVEEPPAFADGLECAVERDGPGAVSVAEQASVVGGESTHVRALDAGGQLGVLVAGFDGWATRK